MTYRLILAALVLVNVTSSVRAQTTDRQWYWSYEAPSEAKPVVSPAGWSMPAEGVEELSPQPVTTRCCPPDSSDGCRGWYAGAGAAFVQPRWSTNPALLIGRGILGPVIEDRSFNWDLNAAPYVWLGYTGEQGRGFRLQWFSFDGNSGAESQVMDGFDVQAVSTPSIGGLSSSTFVAGDTLTAWSGLKLQAIDAEFTKALVLRRGHYLFSAGGRYAYISQSYHSRMIDNTNVTQEVFDAGHSAGVFGPTAAVQARYPSALFPRLGLYGKARGALLFGHTNRTATLDIIGLVANYTNSGDAFVPAAEAEVGLDWNQAIGRTVFFAQVGLAAQGWFGVGNAAGSSLGAPLLPVPITSTDTSDLGLYGLKTAVGFNF